MKYRIQRDFTYVVQRKIDSIWFDLISIEISFIGRTVKTWKIYFSFFIASLIGDKRTFYVFDMALILKSEVSKRLTLRQVPTLLRATRNFWREIRNSPDPCPSEMISNLEIEHPGVGEIIVIKRGQSVRIIDD